MAKTPEQIGREILPIPDIPSKGKIALDARNAEFPPIEPLRPPGGAPNVVIVMIDDMGFGATSVVGGPCKMLALQQIADDGLLYNRLVIGIQSRNKLRKTKQHNYIKQGKTSCQGNT